MKWVKFTERWPPLDDDEIIVRIRGQSERTARKVPFMETKVGTFFLSDCTQPQQNCYLPVFESEWLED